MLLRLFCFILPSESLPECRADYRQGYVSLVVAVAFCPLNLGSESPPLYTPERSDESDSPLFYAPERSDESDSPPLYAQERSDESNSPPFYAPERSDKSDSPHLYAPERSDEINEAERYECSSVPLVNCQRLPDDVWFSQVKL